MNSNAKMSICIIQIHIYDEDIEKFGKGESKGKNKLTLFSSTACSSLYELSPTLPLVASDFEVMSSETVLLLRLFDVILNKFRKDP